MARPPSERRRPPWWPPSAIAERNTSRVARATADQVNWAACLIPADAREARSARASLTARAHASGVRSRTTTAAGPLVSSRPPEPSATSTGVPHAMASRAVIPNPSWSDGTASTSAARYRSTRSSSATGPSHVQFLDVAAMRWISSPPNPTAPASTRCQGLSPRCLTAASISTSKPLRASSEPTASAIGPSRPKRRRMAAGPRLDRRDESCHQPRFRSRESVDSRCPNAS